MKDQIIDDEELGRLVLRVNQRAQRFVFRTKSDAIHVTIPPHVTLQEVKEAVEKVREQLLATQEKVVRLQIDLDYRIDTQHFKLSLISGTREQFLAHSELGVTQITCPPHADFADDNLQGWLQKVIEEALRRNAKVILPSRLDALAKLNRLEYQCVKINSSQGRWGSCSSTKSINLSYFLVLLPQHLIDYVLLHELCHTREMNHSDRFWALLNNLTQGKALALREELKQYKTSL